MTTPTKIVAIYARVPTDKQKVHIQHNNTSPAQAGASMKCSSTRRLPAAIPKRPAFQAMLAVAEFEKDIIRERVVAGLATARAKGERLRPPPLLRLSRRPASRGPLLQKKNRQSPQHRRRYHPKKDEQIKRQNHF